MGRLLDISLLRFKCKQWPCETLVLPGRQYQNFVATRHRGEHQSHRSVFLDKGFQRRNGKSKIGTGGFGLRIHPDFSRSDQGRCGQVN